MAPDPGDPHLATLRQFGRQAGRYAVSRVHAGGESLRLVADIAAAQPGERALDVGTGAGFTAFALSDAGARTLATDISPGMVSQACRLAKERRLEQMAFALAGAEALPFTDEAFDLVTCRLAAHHFADVRGALAEFRRVLRAAGRLVLCDTLGAEDDAVTAYQHDLEVRRDATHVRDYPFSLWQQMLAEAGLEVIRSDLAPSFQEFDGWVGRSGTPAELIPDLRRDLAEAPSAVRREFDIRLQDDAIHWHWMQGVFLARKPQEP